MKLPSPPRLVRPHVALAVEMLERADVALSDLWDALAAIEIEEQSPLDCFQVDGFRATCQLLVSLCGEVGACMSGTAQAVRDCIARCEGTEANLPGLELAELCLQFALSAIEEALDVLDRINDGNDWYGPLTAAYSVVDAMQSVLCCSIARQGAVLAPRHWNPSNN